MTPWVMATSSTGKVRELAHLLAPLGLDLQRQSVFGVQSCEEPFQSFLENALVKARHASAQTGLPALADDSGLMVDALNHRPGVRTSDHDWAWLLEAMQGVPESGRAAQFVCVLVAVRSAEDPLPIVAQGLWRGTIAMAPRGESGFGYDPVFVDTDSGLAAAEMSLEQKSALSHRGRAARDLCLRWPR